MTLLLGKEQPFAQGGNRLCFVDPRDRHCCIKVRRPDFTLADRRRKKGFPKNLRPLSSFDDNLEESRVMAALQHRYGEPVFQHVSRCFGFVDTDLGRGLASELIRDGDGAISQTLKKVLWDEGMTAANQAAIDQLTAFWERQLVPSRHLLLHNIVVQRNDKGEIERLVVIDGLGEGGGLPSWLLPMARRRKKAARKTAYLHQRIDELLRQREAGRFPGTHGLLFHNDHPGGAAPQRDDDGEATR